MQQRRPGDRGGVMGVTETLNKCLRHSIAALRGSLTYTPYAPVDSKPAVSRPFGAILRMFVATLGSVLRAPCA
ncbi:hypothetical protein GCM10007160_41070 [Litchfieldella qijiaojingensis]|uniref:Uncharacterized protein n=1 Tax=Litchfieldella qijiaojingensis TaxID=980347 RepID=A0ABQ2ZBJ5_9GAMM|nr:hypothetical protein GCM10007160_41070 [Halomonas qijiaojingensis]